MDSFQYSSADFIVHHTLDMHPDPDVFYMHTHDFNEIYVFLGGKGVFRVEGTEYPLHKGDVLIMRRAESHCLMIDPDTPYERAVIHFSEATINRFDTKNVLLAPFYKRELGKRNLLRAADFKDNNYISILKNVFADTGNRDIQILSNLPSLLNEIRIAFEKTIAGSGGGSETLTGEIIGYINRHLTEGLSLDSLCAEFYISKPQLCRIFKNSTGSTVWEYITVKRLMAARQMIGRGEPPTRAAVLSGFNDYSAFYRAYCKKFGCSPKESFEL